MSATGPSSGSTLGLVALRDELAEQGVDEATLLAGTRIARDWFVSPDPPLVQTQRIAVIRNAWRLARRPDTALRAGARQRVSDFGLYGYALASSTTFADALRFGMTHLELAGPVLRITFERRGNTGVFISHNPHSLGPLLPFVAEFWRSSMTALMSRVLEQPFPSRAMYFPYPAPAHLHAYREAFQCPLHFGARVMEWHFDAAVLDAPCPNASQLTAQVCTNFCERVLSAGTGQSALQREIRLICLGYGGRYPTAHKVAAQLGMSLRSFFRRLREEGVSFQELLNEVRRSVAIEYLEATRIPVEEIAHRVGFSDSANFRKAFRRWTGNAPRHFRRGRDPS